MGWAKIKKAINSTLGTGEFQPLDEIILGTKGLKASDNFYTQIYQGDAIRGSAEPNSKIMPVTLKMNWQGSFRLKVTSYKANSGGNFSVLINDVISTGFDSTYSSFGDTFIDVSFNKGDIIKFKLTGTGNGFIYVNQISMYADVVDLSAFEMYTEE